MFYIASSYSVTASVRSVIANLQADLARGQREMTTGRHADPGVALGVRASRSFTLIDARETVEALRAANDLVSARLTSTQTALDALLAEAKDMRATLLAAQTDGGQKEAVIVQARQALSAFVARLNSSDGEGFLFGGIKTDVAPLANYFAEPSQANKAALDAAFASAFGFAQTDPAVASITETRMRDFLANEFDALFSEAGWRADWSRASDRPLESQIGLSRVIDSSITANEPPLRELATAYVMVADLGAEKMNQESYAVVLKGGLNALNGAIASLTKTQARLGVMQNEVRRSSDLMAVQSDTLLVQLQEIEGVDQSEAAARVSGLMTQIEAAYALTARVSQLSLTKYL
ncbi:flagellar hook-associated family protein [Methylocystis sp. S23]